MKFLKPLFIWLLRFFTIIFILLVAVYFLVSSPKFLVKATKYIISKQMLNVTLHNLNVGKVTFSINDCILQNTVFDLTSQGQHIAVNVKSIHLHNLWSNTSQIFIDSAKITHELVTVDNLFISGNLIQSKGFAFKGLAQSNHVKIENYSATKVKSLLFFENQRFDFKNLMFNFYKGKVFAIGSITLQPQISFSTHLDLNNVDTTFIDRLNEKYKGKVNGIIEAKGRLPYDWEHLKAELSSSQGNIESGLLKFLAYSGDLVRINKAFPFLDKIFGDKKFIDVENFKMKAHNASPNSLEVECNLSSKELNLKLNPTITINLR